ncbi:MAG TPA: tetratricopeptide repeat protein [Candidatus Binatia bacterium]|nr:tetratricopeptide repeat protein [Candidatus Binatia bacterium]
MARNDEDFEKRLQAMLDRLSLPSRVTILDIKDIVWNENAATDFSQLIGILIKDQENEGQVHETAELIQEAWNTYPHKVLGGKSPLQMVEGYKQSTPGHNQPKIEAVSSRKRKTLSEVFKGIYPEEARLVKMGRSEWGFEFPQLYHRLSEQLLDLEESDCSAEEYEGQLLGMLKLMPELFDANNELAHFYGYNDDFKSAKTVYETAVDLARAYIPPEFVKGKHHIQWGYLDNRPFLRLLNDYAQFTEFNGKLSRAIPLYEELLSYNPNDNQGVRYVLTTAYLKANDPEKVIQLAAKYPGETGPDLVMGKVLALFKLGRNQQARTYLQRNKKYQTHVIRELLKATHPRPKEIYDDRVNVGGDDEAWYYWQDQGDLWAATKGAKDFLKEFVVSLSKQ